MLSLVKEKQRRGNLDGKVLSSINLYLKMKVKILTEEFEEMFKDYPLYSQEDESDRLAVAKLFDPCSAVAW